MPVKTTNNEPAKVPPPARQDSVGLSPFRTLERFADDVTRIFDVSVLGDLMTRVPSVDITRHGDELLIRADLPGLTKDDIKLTVTEDAVTIQGERHRAQEEERDGVYRIERHYGAFSRTIELPADSMTDEATASFENGVLEIRIPAAPATEGRPLDIAG